MKGGHRGAGRAVDFSCGISGASEVRAAAPDSASCRAGKQVRGSVRGRPEPNALWFPGWAGCSRALPGARGSPCPGARPGRPEVRCGTRGPRGIQGWEVAVSRSPQSGEDMGRGRGRATSQRYRTPLPVSLKREDFLHQPPRGCSSGTGARRAPPPGGWHPRESRFWGTEGLALPGVTPLLPLRPLPLQHPPSPGLGPEGLPVRGGFCG